MLYYFLGFLEHSYKVRINYFLQKRSRKHQFKENINAIPQNAGTIPKIQVSLAQLINLLNQEILGIFGNFAITRNIQETTGHTHQGKLLR